MREHLRHSRDSEQWAIDRLVEAVADGDADAKRLYGERLLEGYEESDWYLWDEVSLAPFVPAAALDPTQAEADDIYEVFYGSVSDSRLAELMDGATMTESEVVDWQLHALAGCSAWEMGPYWTVLEVRHSASVRRRAYMAVTEWRRTSGCFVAAYPTCGDALNALKQVGFVSLEDYLARAGRTPTAVTLLQHNWNPKYLSAGRG